MQIGAVTLARALGSQVASGAGLTAPMTTTGTGTTTRFQRGPGPS
jgi:hypothetical protein